MCNWHSRETWPSAKFARPSRLLRMVKPCVDVPFSLSSTRKTAAIVPYIDYAGVEKKNQWKYQLLIPFWGNTKGPMFRLGIASTVYMRTCWFLFLWWLCLRCLLNLFNPIIQWLTARRTSSAKLFNSGVTVPSWRCGLLFMTQISTEHYRPELWLRCFSGHLLDPKLECKTAKCHVMWIHQLNPRCHVIAPIGKLGCTWLFKITSNEQETIASTWRWWLVWHELSDVMKDECPSLSSPKMMITNNNCQRTGSWSQSIVTLPLLRCSFLFLMWWSSS